MYLKHKVEVVGEIGYIIMVAFTAMQTYSKKTYLD